jgi:hypothetical protein
MLVSEDGFDGLEIEWGTAAVEEVLNALHDLLAAIWQLYHNGIRPELGVRKYGYEERIERITTTTMSA